MKAVLVLDEMPEACRQCGFFEFAKDPYCDYFCEATGSLISARAGGSKPDWCPLKKLPDKLSMDDYDEHVPEEQKKLLEYYNDGFNDCLNQVLGKED